MNYFSCLRNEDKSLIASIFCNGLIFFTKFFKLHIFVKCKIFIAFALQVLYILLNFICFLRIVYIFIFQNLYIYGVFFCLFLFCTRNKSKNPNEEYKNITVFHIKFYCLGSGSGQQLAFQRCWNWGWWCQFGHIPVYTFVGSLPKSLSENTHTKHSISETQNFNYFCFYNVLSKNRADEKNEINNKNNW